MQGRRVRGEQLPRKERAHAHSPLAPTGTLNPRVVDIPHWSTALALEYKMSERR